VYGSLAAPTFIFLAGMMTGYSSAPFLCAIRRAGWRMLVLWAWAVSIDVAVWGIAPFNSFDVLYVIGLSLPVAELCRVLDLRFHALAAGAVVLLTPLLQQRYGYRLALSESGSGTLAWQRFVIDGWFPMFPWLGVALCGALLGRLRRASSRWAEPRVLLSVASVLCALGCIAWSRLRQPFPTRAGYSELLYPPSLAMVGVALGCVLVLLTAVRAWPRSLRWLEVYGRASLPLYVVHSALIAFILKRLFPERPLLEFLFLYGLHLALLWLVAHSLQVWARERSERRAESARPLAS
jgi:uncharacterized membrane protein